MASWERGYTWPNPALADTERLRLIHDGLTAVIAQKPASLMIGRQLKQIFVAKSASSALRLGMARGVGLVVCGQAGLGVSRNCRPRGQKSSVGHRHGQQKTGAGHGQAAACGGTGQCQTLLMRWQSAIAVANEAGHALPGALDSTSGLTAAIAAALARADAANGGAK